MIRTCNFSDIKQILEIELEAFPKSAYKEATFIYYKYMCPDTFLVWESNGELVGYIIFYDSGHIISIAVKYKNRRQGVGSKFVHEVFKRTGGKAKVEVRESNTGAQEFYNKLGFSEVSRIKNYYGNKDAIIMERCLEQVGL